MYKCKQHTQYGSLSWHCTHVFIIVSTFLSQIPISSVSCLLRFYLLPFFSKHVDFSWQVFSSFPPFCSFVLSFQLVMSLHISSSTFPLKKINLNSSSPPVSLLHLSASQSTASATQTLDYCGGEFVLYFTPPSSSSLPFLLLLLWNSSQFPRSTLLLNALSLRRGARLPISLDCSWHSLWSKVLLISPFAPPLPLHLCFPNCLFQPVSIPSLNILNSPNHFLSAVQCCISAWGTLSNYLTAFLHYSYPSFHLHQTLLIALPSTKTVVWCWTI